jgi:hypothetical protein
MTGSLGRRVGVVAVVALVLLAGCSGAGNTTETTAETTDATTTAVATDTTGATTTQAATEPETGGDGDAGTGDKNGDANGDSDGNASVGAGVKALRNHVQTLESAESYTVRYVINNTGPSGPANGTGVVYVGENGARLLNTSLSQSQGSFGVAQYKPQGESTVYQRRSFGGQVSFSTVSLSQANFGSYKRPISTAENNAPSFRDEGIVETDDGERQRYVVDSVDQLPASLQESPGNFTEVELVMFVDPSTGAIDEFRQRLTVESDGEVQSTVATLTYEDVGSTTVPEPGWLSDARRAANTTTTESN